MALRAIWEIFVHTGLPSDVDVDVETPGENGRPSRSGGHRLGHYKLCDPQSKVPQYCKYLNINTTLYIIWHTVIMRNALVGTLGITCNVSFVITCQELRVTQILLHICLRYSSIFCMRGKRKKSHAPPSRRSYFITIISLCFLGCIWMSTSWNCVSSANFWGKNFKNDPREGCWFCSNRTAHPPPPPSAWLELLHNRTTCSEQMFGVTHLGPVQRDLLPDRPLSARDNITQLALFPVFFVIRRMYLSKLVARTCGARTAPMCIVLGETGLTGALWGKWICPQLSVHQWQNFNLLSSVFRPQIHTSLTAGRSSSLIFFLSPFFLFFSGSEPTAQCTPPHQCTHTCTCFIRLVELNDFIVIIVWQGQYRSSSFMKNDSFQTPKKAYLIFFFKKKPQD